MSEIEKAVAGHYTHGSVTATILAALEKMGRRTERIDPDDLAGVDEFHVTVWVTTSVRASE